jgi:hypothetical protein
MLRPFVLAAILATSLFGCATPRAAPAQVYVVGTLYKRHQDVPGYGLGQLRQVLTAIDPDVFVLDVTPTELRERKVWPGKIEYPGAIFPLLKPDRHRLYAGEPDEPLFTEIVSAVAGAHKEFAAAHPESAAALEQLTAATYTGLLHHWRSPAEVNDEVTQELLAGKKALERRLVGPVFARDGERWHEHVAGVIHRAVAENAGRRIVVLVGIENRDAVNRRLRGSPGITLVDMERWLREHVRAGSAAAPASR